MSADTIITEIRRRSGWSIFLGAVTAILGLVLLAHPFATGTLTTVVVGWMLTLGGVAEVALAFVAQTPGGFFLRLLVGALYGLTGIALLAFPFTGTESLTLFVGMMLIARGVFVGIAGFEVRGIPAWGWLAADAVSSLVAGLLIVVKWPSSSAWALGTLVGAAVLMTGLSRIVVAAVIHGRAGQVAHAAGR
jgi:uncharacterized membrane protein HdeD (DUF308 family)